MLGNTPLVRLKKIEEEFGIYNEIYAKVENTNPSGSVKDRAVYQMLLDFKEEGKLKEGTTVIEATSGNTGISLSYFQNEFKINAIIVMPKSMTKERREMIAKYGAKLVLVDGGMKESNLEAEKLHEKIKDSLFLGQFDNPSNVKAHYLNTARELDRDLEKIDYVFAGFGTGGTISGIGKYFKEKKYATKIIGIEPYESPLVTKGEAHPHLIQGIGANFIPNNLKQEFIDEVITCKGEEALAMARTIRKIEGIDCGYTSGASLNQAIHYLKDNNIKGKRIVVVFPDKGDRYSW